MQETFLFEQVTLPDEQERKQSNPREFRVKIRLVNTINMHELERFLSGRMEGITDNTLTCVMALNNVFRNQPAGKFVSWGPSFYFPNETKSLTGGAEAWAGMFMSARPAPGRMMLNLDVSATAFVKSGSIIQFVVEVLEARGPADLRNGLSDMARLRLEKLLRNVKFAVTHRGDNKGRYAVAKLSKRGADEERFECEDKTISIVQYFRTHWNRALDFPKL